MNGLSTFDNLNKEAIDKSTQGNVKKLIVDEAYSQIANEFPSLVKNIVSVEILEMIDSKTAVGAAIIIPSSGGDSRFLIPVIYTNGLVDATSFIFSEDNDIMLALTKKVAKIFTRDESGILGMPAKDDDIKTLDPGNIRKLFVPPKTYSPKTASAGSFLFAVVEKSDLVKTALAKKLEDKEYREAFEDIYGKDSSEMVAHQAKMLSIGKEAVDKSSPEIVFSRKEIIEKGWMNKTAAAKELAENGFAISHGSLYPTKSLCKTAGFLDIVKAKSGIDSVESISPRSLGQYKIYSTNGMSTAGMLIINDAESKSPKVIFGKNVPRHIRSINTESADDVIFNKHNVFFAGEEFDTKKSNEELIRFINENFNTIDIQKHLSKTVNDDYATPEHILILDGEGGVKTSFSFPNANNISNSLGAITIPIWHNNNMIVIEKNSDKKPVQIGRKLYVGEKNIIALGNPDGEVFIPATSDSVDTLNNEPIVKIAYDNGEFYMNGSRYSDKSIVEKLASDGYDKFSIYDIVKEAKDNGSSSMSTINAKIDMLASMVMNLAGKLDSSSQVLEQIKQKASMKYDNVSQVEEPDVDQQNAEIDDASARDIAMMDNGAQEANGFVPDDNKGYDNPPQNNEQMPGDVPNVEHIEGVNTSIDPEILKTVKDIKNSQIVDISVINTLGINEEMASIVNDYKDEILTGVSALGKVLFNLKIRRNSLEEDIGEAKYKNIETTMSSVFIRASDLYVDVFFLGLESNGNRK